MLLPFGLAATGVLVPFSQLSPSRQHALCCDPGVSAIKAVGLACKTLCFPLFQVEGQPFLALSVCGGGGVTLRRQTVLAPNPTCGSWKGWGQAGNLLWPSLPRLVPTSPS